MNMTPSAMRRLALPLLSMLLLSVSVEAQRMVVPALPAPPEAKEALFGSIAPDGRSFVYEVVEGDERLLWRLDLGSLRAERLTPAPGVRYHPVWAPDGKHLAYWRNHPLSRGADGSEGLYLLDADSGTEQRLVKSVDDDAGLSGDVTWLTDGRILYWHMLERPNLGGGSGRSKLVAMRPDGAVTKSPPPWIDRSDDNVISPGGSKVAYIASCCGGALRSIWVRDPAGARCVAGPIVTSMQSERTIAWSRDEKRLYLVAREIGGADTLDHAFAIDLERAEGWRIGPLDRAVASVSVSDAGDVFLTFMPVRGRVGSLWIMSASSVRKPGSGAERLKHCPPMATPIVDFVRRAKLPSVHWIDPVYEDSAHRLTIFSVTYGNAYDIYPTRTGVRYGSRIGWLDYLRLFSRDSVRRTVSSFPMRSSDAYLFSDSLAARLQRVPQADESWRLFLVRNPATPFDVILREVRRDPHGFALLALDNPSVTRDTIPFDARLKLAVLEDTLAAAMVGLPSVRNDPERLAQIADLPMYRSGGGLAALRVQERLAQLGPSLVANVRTLSERAALQAYMAAYPDSLRIAMLHALSPPQSRVVLALAAVRSLNPRAQDVAFARATLSGLGSTSERELLDAIRRVRTGELPGTLPEFMFSDWMKIPWPVLDAISRLDERFRHARGRAALELGADPSTPDSVFRVLWEGLSRHRDPALAARFLERAHADTSRALLRAVAQLDSSWYGSVAQEGRERLARLVPPDPPSLAPHRPSRLHYPPPSAPDSLAPGSWMPTDQCLAPDDWSEQLRHAIGGDAQLLAGHWLCIRAAEALERAFDLPQARDSTYVFGVADGYVLAFPPSRPDADVTLVRFDTAFTERSRRVVRVQ
jgi:hypothetical protein